MSERREVRDLRHLSNILFLEPRNVRHQERMDDLMQVLFRPVPGKLREKGLTPDLRDR